jgi:hypothetical protein
MRPLENNGERERNVRAGIGPVMRLRERSYKISI